MYRFRREHLRELTETLLSSVKWKSSSAMRKWFHYPLQQNPDDVQIEQASCWLTYTNEKTHEIIRKNLDRSPLFSGND